MCTSFRASSRTITITAPSESGGMQVWRARVLETGEDVVIKIALSEQEHNQVIKEDIHLRQFHSDHIVKRLGRVNYYNDHPSNYMFDGLVLECCPEGDLWACFPDPNYSDDDDSQAAYQFMDNVQLYAFSVTCSSSFCCLDPSLH
jgi:hypothetical protein